MLKVLISLIIIITLSVSVNANMYHIKNKDLIAYNYCKLLIKNIEYKGIYNNTILDDSASNGDNLVLCMFESNIPSIRGYSIPKSLTILYDKSKNSYDIIDID